MNKSTTLLGLDLYNGRYSDFFQKIQNPKQKTLVFTPNPEILVRASRDSEFMNILRQATYNVPDGNGLYVAYMMQSGMSFLRAGLRVFFEKKGVKKEYGELIKGSDLVHDILISGKDTPRKILILDRENTLPKNEFEKKKAQIQKNLKSLIEEKFVGNTIWVIFDGNQKPSEIATLVQSEGIDYIFSCIGMKNQEKRLIEVYSHLSESQRVVGFGVGASIDFLLGLQRRAPKIFQNLGLEWFYRLITQPRIRARRIWDAIYHFPKLIKNSSKD